MELDKKKAEGARGQSVSQQKGSVPWLTIVLAMISSIAFLISPYSLIDVTLPFAILAMGGMGFLITLMLYLLFCRRWGAFRLLKRLLTVLSVFLMLLFFLGIVFDLSAITDENGMEHYLRDHMGTAKWIYFMLCFMQPVMLPIPEAVTVVAGSSVFGSFPAFAIGFLGTWLGIALMFVLSRVGGLKLIQRWIPQQKLDKYHSYVAKNETLILIVLFIIPILPDELICIGAGISGMTVKRFLAIAAVSKLLTSFLLAYSVVVAKWWSLTTAEFVLMLSGMFLIGYVLWRGIRKCGR